MRSKSTRKALRDVSNLKNVVKSRCKKADDAPDRLLLLNSEVSSLLRQIDELVFQALQLRDDHGRKEIKQFADVLSDMKASLKPWIPRFQKALNSQMDGPAANPDESHETSVACPISKDKCASIQSPEPTNRTSLVSQSPLVPWRAECNTEVGRQLFVLTPMPPKKGCPIFETISSKENAERASPSGLVGTSVGDLLEFVSVNRPAEKALDETFGMIHCSLRDKYSKSKMNGSCSPFLNMSPPKSCTLLEPVSLLTRKRCPFGYRCTPFPKGLQNSLKSLDSESPGSLPTDDVSLKYLEILGIKTVSLGDIRQELDDSLGWMITEGVSVNRPTEKALDETFGMIHCSLRDKYSNSKMNRSCTPFLNMSPPKSCTLLEPVLLLTRKRCPFGYRCTPFPKGRQNSLKSLDSESPGSLPTDDVSAKYPEILGIKTISLGDTRQELDDSLRWIGSPPKTCSVMEPPHEKSLVNPGCPSPLPEVVNAGTSQNDDMSSLNESFRHGGSCITSNNLLRDDGGKLDVADCTPMVKEPMSSYRKGKHPGENTLKKELWTKFEAASSHAICFKHPTLQKAA